VGFRPQFCNDRDSCVYSTSTFAGTSLASGITNAIVVGVAGIPISSFPYSRPTMLSNNGGLASDSLYRPRLVSFGADITYSGKAIDRAGTIYTLTAVAGEDVSQRTMSQIIANPQSVKYSVNDMQHAYVTLHGTLREHYNLQNPEVSNVTCLPDPSLSPQHVYYDYHSGSASSSPPCAAVVLISATPGSTFNVDIIVHYEVGGEGPGCLLTPCFADEASLSVANNVSKVSQSIQKANPHVHKSSIAQTAVSIGMNAGGAALSKRGAAMKKKGGMYAVAGEGMQLGGGIMKSKSAQRSVAKLFKL